MTQIFLLIVILAVTSMTLDLTRAAPQVEPAPTQSIMKLYTYNDCDGKDANNYTLLVTPFIVTNCDISTIADAKTGTGTFLIQNDGKHQHSVNSLTPLVFSIYPAGAYNKAETLWLCSGGPLQGKYFYEKTLWLEISYLKKCSSVLGYSYVSSKSGELLINDKLDMNVLISPTGGYEVFKKGCTTVCSGGGYLV